MTKVVHRSHITITREKGPTRKAEIEGFSEPVFYGVHGGIKDFYKIEPEEEHAATLDHIVGAVGGWMMGTLAAVLAGKKIRTFQDRYKATVSGDIEDVNGVLKITRINVDYWLKLPKDKRQEAEEALNNYLSLCPGAQSVIGCIDINHTLTMEDLADWRYILLKKQGLWLENHRLDERGFMNQEVHVVCCEDVGVRSPRATQLIIYFDNGRIKYCASNL